MFLATFKILIARKEFFGGLVLEHLLISGVSILLAGIIGLALGVFISEYKKASPLVLGFSNVVYTIPSISMFGFLIPISGIGDNTAVIALTVYALLPMLRNTFTGLDNVSEAVIEAATGMGSTRAQILLKIKLPMAVAVILAGLRNMVVMTISTAGIASFIGAGGLGVAIYRGIATNNIPMMVAGSLLIAALALAADYVFGLLEVTMRKRWRL
jgi:osmoprotectant transport system permease protein